VVYGAGSAGSIAGVFTSGYVLIDLMSLPRIFGMTGALMVTLAIVLALCPPALQGPAGHGAREGTP
jgi:hypothetical protein